MSKTSKNKVPKTKMKRTTQEQAKEQAKEQVQGRQDLKLNPVVPSRFDDLFSDENFVSSQDQRQRQTAPERNFSFSPAPFESMPLEFNSRQGASRQTGRQSKSMSTVQPVFQEPDTKLKSKQVSMLANFWNETDLFEDNEKENQREDHLFIDSVRESDEAKIERESLSKRMQFRLSEDDAELLEELYLQSRAAGLKNVSRARILRVALRHFHTCWLNADQD